MEPSPPNGQVIILNGAPRSGKSTIASAIQEIFEGPWLNLGVDTFKECATPARYQPGIGLRPGGERPDLEEFIRRAYAAMYESIAAHSRLGLNVVVDVGHHDSYSKSLNILLDCARRLRGLPVLFVGVRCSLEIIMERRRATGWTDLPADAPVPDPVRLWQEAAHAYERYDMELDTGLLDPMACVEAIRRRLEEGPVGTVFEELAGND